LQTAVSKHRPFQKQNFSSAAFVSVVTHNSKAHNEEYNLYTDTAKHLNTKQSTLSL